MNIINNEFYSFVFICENDFSVVIEAETKGKAIQKFEHEFIQKFEENWQVYRVNNRIDIEGVHNLY